MVSSIYAKACHRRSERACREKYILANEAGNVAAPSRLPEDWELEEALASRTTTEKNDALRCFGMKWCAACAQAKPLTDFHRSKHTPSGVVASCKQCRREKDQAHLLSQR